MSGLTEPLSFEALLAEQDFVRRLARGLLFDEHRVDDVVQQTWVAALRNPPRDRAAVRGWLARVVRNLARNDARAAVRRQRGERNTAALAADTGAAAPTDEVFAREEERRLLVDALRGLPEPYRGTLVLRYFEDYTPSQIARQLGIPAATARTRLRRGLELLRADLDRRHGGDRRAWCMGLIGLAVPRGRAGWASWLPWQQARWIAAGWAVKLCLMGVAAGMVGLVAWLWVAQGAAGPGAPAAPPERGAARAAAAPAVAAQPPAASERLAVRSAPPASAGAAADESLSGLRGRVLGTDGAPRGGVAVELAGLDPVSLFAPESARALDLYSAQAQTAGDGRFLLRDVRPRGVYALRLRDGGAFALHVLARTPGPGEVVDLGDLRLSPTTRITGQVLSPDGAPAAGAEVWCADGVAALRAFVPVEQLDPRCGALVALPRRRAGEAHAAFAPRLRGFLGTKLFTERLDLDDPELALHLLEDPGWLQAIADFLPLPRTRADAEGVFVLEGVRPGANAVVVSQPGAERLVRQTTARADEARDLGTLRLLPGLRSVVAVADADGHPVAGAEVRWAPLGRTPFRGVAFCTSRAVTDRAGRCSAAGLPRGPVLVAVRRSASHGWIAAGPFEADEEATIALPALHRLAIVLRAPAGVAASALDEAQWRLLAGPILGELDRAGLQPALALEPSARSPGSGEYAFDGLEPGSYTFELRVAGCVPLVRSVTLPEESELELELTAAVPLDIEVRRPDGTPAEGARVYAVAEPAPDWTRPLLPSGYGLPRWTTLPVPAGRTDARGQLRIATLPAGQAHLAVDHPTFGQAAASVKLPHGGPLLVELPANGALEGVLLERGRPASPAAWMLRLEPNAPRCAAGMPWREALATPDAEGRFRVEGLVPGRYELIAMAAIPAPASLSSFVEMLRGAVLVSGSDARSTQVEIFSGRTSEARLDTDPSMPKPGDTPAHLVGTLRINGVPQAGVQVHRGAYFDDAVVATTDSQGSWSQDPIAAGEHALRLVREDVELWAGKVTLSAGEARQLDIDLRETTLTGTAWLGSGERLDGHRVFAVGTPEGAAGGRCARHTDLGADGRFALTLPRGVYELQVAGPTAKGVLRDVQVPAAGSPTTEVHIELELARVFSGQLLGARPGARLLVLSENDLQIVAVDDSGRFHIVEPEPTKTQLAVRQDGQTFHTEPPTVDLSQGSIRDFVLRVGEPRDG